MDTSPKFSSFLSISEIFPRWNVSVYSNLKSDLPEDASALSWSLGLTPRIAMEVDPRHLVLLPCVLCPKLISGLLPFLASFFM